MAVKMLIVKTLSTVNATFVTKFLIEKFCDFWNLSCVGISVVPCIFFSSTHYIYIDGFYFEH